MAQFKFTVMLMANGPLRITSGAFQPELYKSEHDVQDPELKVSTSTRDDKFLLLRVRCMFCSLFTCFLMLLLRLCCKVLQVARLRKRRKRRLVIYLGPVHSTKLS